MYRTTRACLIGSRAYDAGDPVEDLPEDRAKQLLKEGTMTAEPCEAEASAAEPEERLEPGDVETADAPPADVEIAQPPIRVKRRRPIPEV